MFDIPSCFGDGGLLGGKAVSSSDEESANSSDSKNSTSLIISTKLHLLSYFLRQFCKTNG
jgi:hypothetical protein